MIDFHAVETDHGAAVCHWSPTLGHYVTDVDCSTLRTAQNIAALKNLEQQRAATATAMEANARTERRSVRSCLPGLCRA